MSLDAVVREAAAKVRQTLAEMSDAELLAWVVRLESPTAELRAERSSRRQAREPRPVAAEAPSEEVATSTSRPPLDAVLAALKEGPASVSQIAYQTGLDRVRAQNCLQHLRRQGRARSPARRGGDWKAT